MTNVIQGPSAICQIYSKIVSHPLETNPKKIKKISDLQSEQHHVKPGPIYQCSPYPYRWIQNPRPQHRIFSREILYRRRNLSKIHQIRRQCIQLRCGNICSCTSSRRHATIRQKNPKIDTLIMFSDNSGAIKIIFDSKPHPSQAVSIQFRTAVHDMFIDQPNLKLFLNWTPGHRGMEKIKRADQLAKSGCKKQITSTFTFSSLSHTLSQINKVNPLQRWKKHIENNPIKETSSFYRPSFILHPHLKVPKWFKPISRPITSRLNQAITGHSYIQSYFKWFNIPCQQMCDYSNKSTIPHIPQTCKHIFTIMPTPQSCQNQTSEGRTTH